MSPRDRTSISPSASSDNLSSDSTGTTEQSKAPLVPQESAKCNGGTEKEEKMAQERIEKSRDDHDLFNLVALLLIVISMFLNWDVPGYLLGGSLQDTWHGSSAHRLFALVATYFVIDYVWVTVKPDCVKSPGTIKKHHVVAMLYNAGAWYYPEFNCFYGLVLSVEVNTWFLILRRFLYKRKEFTPAIIRDLVEVAFYTSWISIRVIAYNLVLYEFIMLANERIILYGSYFQGPFVFVITHFFLCVLNLKWTFDLFTPIIHRLLNTKNHSSNISHTL